MLFSIIVPVYRVEEWLDRCVTSLLSQTYRDLEILLVDDGSPDRSGEMCDAFAARDGRVRVIHKENGGLSDARNAGLREATGEYVLFVDSDDAIAPDTCEVLAKAIGEHPGIDLLVGDAEVIGQQDIYRHDPSLAGCVLTGEEFLIRAMRPHAGMPMIAAVNVARREFLSENGLAFKVGILHEDEEFTPRLFLAAKSVLYVGRAFYLYYYRENSITTRPDKRRNMEHLFTTLNEHEARYRTLDNKKLRRLMLDSLAAKYLSLYKFGDFPRYGKAYVHKKFALRTAKRPLTRAQALLFAVSPRLYCKLHEILFRG